MATITITGATANYVVSADGTTLINLSTVGGAVGVDVVPGLSGAVVINYATISASSGGTGVRLRSGSYLTNQSGGTISGDKAVLAYNAPSTVTNYGEIVGSLGYSEGAGVQIVNGGALTNQASAIVSGYSGVIANTGGTVTNSGTILGSTFEPNGRGVWLLAGGVVSNQPDGTISGLTGVYAAGGVTVTNGGTITGVTGDAVLFAAGFTNRVVIDPGAMFTGTVDGRNTAGSGAVSTLELASGSSPGTLSGLGTQFIHFGQVTVDASAAWTLTAGNAVASGYTLINAGHLYSDIALGAGALLNNIGTISGSGAAAVLGGTDGAATVINAGLIDPATDGIYLQDGGVVTNVSGGTILGATNGIHVYGGPGFVVNQGSITGAGNGVLFNVGGYLTNSLGGTISSGGVGMLESRVAANTTIINQGVLSGGFGALGGYGVVLDGGGHITNQSGGTISGYRAVVANNESVTVTNYGIILGNTTGTISTGMGVRFAAGGILTNESGASVAGFTGVFADVGATVVNAGTILGNATAAGGAGVRFGAGGYLTNSSGGTIAGYTAVVANSAPATLTNDGALLGNATAGYGLVFNAGGYLTNSSGGTISGGSNGVVANSIAVTISNQGSITGGASGVVFNAGGYLTNSSGGTISGGSNGVAGNYVAVTISNQGVLSGGFDTLGGHGVVLAGGGQITNQSGGTISGYRAFVAYNAPATVTNSGVIVGNTTGTVSTGMGVRFAAAGMLTNQASAVVSGFTGVVADAGGTVLNAGTILGNATASGGAGMRFADGGVVTNQSSATVSGYQGVVVQAGGATVTNAGTIAGSTDAVLLAAGATNRVVIDPGAVFTGTVDGGNPSGSTVISTLELASGSSAGTVSGLGTQYIDFAQITIDAGAAWTFANAGQFTGDITLGAGALVDTTGTISGSGTAAVQGPVSGGATLINAGLIDPATYGAYLPSGGVVTNQLGGTIAGTITGVEVTSAAGTVVNAGSIYGSSNIGVWLRAGGTVTNSESAHISGGQYGIQVNGSAGFVTNQGSVTGASGGIRVLTANSYITNSASGSITGGRFGVSGQGVAVTLLNQGYIGANTLASSSGTGVVMYVGGQLTNEASGRIAGDYGVYAVGGTVTNAGTITGTKDAVLLALGYTNRLVIDPGAVFAGTVDGGNTIGSTSVSTLELASGSSPGTLSGLGTQYIDFAQVTIDIGAAWTLAGSNTVAGGGTLKNAGQLAGDITLGAGALVNNLGTISGSGQAAVRGPASGGATVINVGLIDPADFGVYLPGGGAVTNHPGGTIVGTPLGILMGAGGSIANGLDALIAGTGNGVQVNSGSGFVSNQGSITGAGSGVVFNAGGYLTNSSGGTISGGSSGVVGNNVANTISNQGSITGGASGVVFNAGGYLTNSSGGTISGGSNGVAGNYVAVTISNQGVLSGGFDTLGGHGVVLAGGGEITNQSGGTISGYRAFVAYNAPATVTNSGVIVGNTTGTVSTGMGVRFAAGGMLTNQASATVTGFTGVFADAGGTVLNAGIILGNTTASGGAAVRFADGGALTNQSSATVSGYQGVVVQAGGATVTNAGTIAGSTDAVRLAAGATNRVATDPGAMFIGTVDGGNAIGSTIISTLELASGSTTGTLSGLGTKYIDFAQVTIDAGAAWTLTGSNTGDITLGAGALVDNIGTISGSGTAAVRGPAIGGATLLNSGLIDPATYGVFLPSGGVVTNQGSITGTKDAVLLSPGDTSRLVIDPGAVFVGTVDGGNTIGATAVSTLELASGGSAGTLSGLGTKYVDFAQITIDAGAAWTLTGTNIVAGGGTLRNAGQITGDITLGAGALVNNMGTISGSGGAAVRGPTSGSATVINVGLIDPAGDGVYLPANGVVTNLPGGTIIGTSLGVLMNAGGTVTNDQSALIAGGGNGVQINSSAGFVSNQGSITGSGSGLVFNAGGYLTNSSSGSISGGSSGVAGNATTIAITINNQGVVSGNFLALGGSGVVLNGGGEITNQSGGTISGYRALVAYNASATLTNAGIILGNTTGTVSTGMGVRIADGGALTNQSGATVVGFTGVFADAGGTVLNAGTILGNATAGPGVLFNAGGYLTNSLGGSISGGSNGVVGNATAVAITVSNQGSITGRSTGLRFNAGGYLTNSAGGSISGGSTGVIGNNATAAITIGNQGVLSGNSGTLGGLGAKLNGGGEITNQLGGTISGYRAVVAYHNAATVTNAGMILGNTPGTVSGGMGVRFAAGGMLTNQSGATVAGGTGVFADAGATVLNAGNILGNTAASGGAGVRFADGGTLTNQSSATVSGYTGVVVQTGAATVTNAGTIVGTKNAVLLAAGATNRAVIDPGAVFGGTVSGGNAIGSTIISTLELASGSSTGTISGLGSHYVDFAQVTLDSGATWQVTGIDSLAAGVAITNAGSLVLANAMLTVAGTLFNNGGIVLDPSTLTGGALLGTGSVTLDAGGTMGVTGAIASGETIVFGGAGAYLHLSDPAVVAGSVTGLGSGQTIDLKGVSPGSVSYGGGLLTMSSVGSFPLAIKNGDTLQIAPSADGTELTALCFCVDTLIQTPQGHVPVQELAVGDLVITQSGVARPITWIGTGAVLATRGRRSAATPVILRKGALGDNVPFQDLRVTKGHSFLLDDVLIPVEFLVNHRTIEWDDRAQEVRIYHVELETHDVLLANGAAAESYRDDGNRWLFQNANSGWALPPLRPCAPVLTGGPIVDAVWRRLLDRAGPRPGVPLTNDPDLHLLVDGTRVDVSEQHGTAHIFKLPAGCASVRVVSRCAAPDELGLARDPRVLGVGLQRIAARQGARFRVIKSGDPALVEGFHVFERANGLRWTNGDAALPAALFKGFRGAMELVLHVGCTAQYPLPGATVPRDEAA